MMVSIEDFKSLPLKNSWSSRKETVFLKLHHGTIIDIKVTKNHLYKLKKVTKNPPNHGQKIIVTQLSRAALSIELPAVKEMW